LGIIIIFIKTFKRKIKSFLIYLRPEYITKHSLGKCPVCSRNTIFLHSDISKNIRNHAICVWCKSASRNRHLAKCLLELFENRGVKKLSDFGKTPELTVLNTSHDGPIAKHFGNAKTIFNTEYFDNIKSGQYKNGIRCENLEQLSLESDSIDLLITEDVFEHVKEIWKAFKEVYRVLKPCGCHVFSIPFYFDKKTKPLFKKDGKDLFSLIEPIEYHGDEIRERIPAFYHLGYDLLNKLAEIGFNTNIKISQYHEYRKYGTYDSYTFISQKPY
jgi:SAM-dependent methyltransferase